MLLVRQPRALRLSFETQTQTNTLPAVAIVALNIESSEYANPRRDRDSSSNNNGRLTLAAVSAAANSSWTNRKHNQRTNERTNKPSYEINEAQSLLFQSSRVRPIPSPRLLVIQDLYAVSLSLLGGWPLENRMSFGYKICDSNMGNKRYFQSSDYMFRPRASSHRSVEYYVL